jgi:hypothetical protein
MRKLFSVPAKVTLSGVITKTVTTTGVVVTPIFTGFSVPAEALVSVPVVYTEPEPSSDLYKPAVSCNTDNHMLDDETF